MGAFTTMEQALFSSETSRSSKSVSYTHLDVYKRQLHGGGPFAMLNIYNFSSTGGRLLLQLDEYSDYADFSDPSWWRTELQQSGYFNGHQYFAVPNVIGLSLIHI